MGKEAAGVKPRHSTSLWMLQAIGTFSKNEEQKMETFLNTCIEAGIALGTKRQLRLVAREPRDRTPYMLSNHQIFPYANDVELLGIIHRIAFLFC